MSRKAGIDGLLADISAAVSAVALARYERVLHEQKWTPIEALFFAAFVAHTEFSEFSYLPFVWGKNGKSQDEAQATMATMADTAIGIFPQCQLPGWRVDFLIGMNDGDRVQWLIVECDGHDFHERTKEQAAKDRSRDRRYQAEGYGVFRFTGSELYKDAFTKADEAFQWLIRRHVGM